MSGAIEQLRIAHHLALRAQHTSEFDAAALVRAWPRLATAARAAHQNLAESGSSRDLVVERIALDAESLGRIVERQPWPGSGRSDAALSQVTSALEAASTTTLTRPLPSDDAAEANRLITSCLWMTSQLVGRSARDHSFDIRMDHTTLDPSTRTKIASAATDMHKRFNAVEQLAASALSGPGRHELPAAGVGMQLRLAVAVWDVEAHRALLSNRSSAVLHVLSHLEAESVKAVEGFVHQAADAHIIDSVTAGRLSPILGDSSASWEQLRDASAELSFASTAVPMTFINSARDLQEAFANASRGAGHDDHPEILHAMSGHLASSVTIAAATRDLIDAGELRAPARAIARLLAEQHPGHSSPKIAPVDAVAIHRGLSLPLDSGTRDILDKPAQRAFRDASETVDRASGLDSLFRPAVPVEPRVADSADSQRSTPVQDSAPMNPSSTSVSPAR